MKREPITINESGNIIIIKNRPVYEKGTNNNQ